MLYVKDPEGYQGDALHRLAPLHGLRVLEVGCGDGHLTRQYAEQTAFVTAIDPDEDEIARARQISSQRLLKRVEFIASSIEDYPAPKRRFDAVIFGWSL